MIGIINVGYTQTHIMCVHFQIEDEKLACGFPLIVDIMILRNVSILTSSVPFSRPARSSAAEGYSALASNMTVWHDESEDDILCDQQPNKPEIMS